MSLNRYGFLYQQYLKENKPALYKGLENNRQLSNVLHKKQDEILEYRNSLYKIIDKDKLFDKKDYKNEEDFEFAVKEYVEKQLNDKMKDFFEEDIKVTDLF